MLLKLDNISASYKKLKVLLDINISVPEGSILGIVGENGSGKTTLLRILAKSLQPKTGTVHLANKNIITLKDEDYFSKIGFLIGEASVYPHLSIFENLNYLAKVHSLPAARINEILEITGLVNHQKKKAKDISLGMKQRLGLGFAFLHQPKLIILDEPMNGLDQQGLNDFKYLIKKLKNEQGVTFIIVSHLFSILDDLITDLAILKEQKLVYNAPFKNNTEYTVEKIYSDYYKQYA